MPCSPGDSPANVIKFQAPEMVFGTGSLAEAGHAARRLGAQRPFVVTDEGLLAAGWVDLGRTFGGDGPGPFTWWSWRGKAFDIS